MQHVQILVGRSGDQHYDMSAGSTVWFPISYITGMEGQSCHKN